MDTETLNSLANASSSYLRSAMRQPVQWREWGDAAFAAAKRENKPILLDIGAVWCHWCHVMDRESYDDPAIAEVVNQNFVAVKVDRDERPDIDSRYQVAVSAISGQGGWPLTAFLTPDGKPFYGGTYFPPQDHYGRPSFRRVLESIAAAYREKQGEITEQASLVEHAIAHSESFSGRSGEFSPQVVEAIVRASLKMFDPRNGGFGGAPKFPHSSVIDLLIEQYVRTGNQELRNVFETTLRRMANGGVYDQLGGGFHRYSVDESWTVPHFEKMSYDNSELLKNYLRAFQATGTGYYAEVARDIVRWMDDWLSDRERGGFYASQDADYSMEDDGDYFTWTLDEARAVLTPEEASVAELRYDINPTGEMHHNPAKNVLYIATSISDIAQRLSLEPGRTQDLLASVHVKMYAARCGRPTPYVDKTIYTGWNAMCISAYLEAAKTLDLHHARQFALLSLDRALSVAWNPEAGLGHVIAYSDPQSPKRDVPGVLDDYALMANACLDAYEATANLTYFNFAVRIAGAMVDRFFDPTSGGFCDTPHDSPAAAQGVLGTRRKPFQDSPTPAGNPVAAIVLLRLHALTGDGAYREKAGQTLEVFAGMVEQYGLFAGTYGIAAVCFSQPHTQVVVVGEDDAARDLYRAAAEKFLFTKSVLRLDRSQAVAQNLPPAMAATIPELPGISSGSSFAVVCSGFSCRPPAASAARLRELLDS